MEINWCQRKKPKYEENSIQPKRKFAQFEPEGFSPRAQIEQIFSEAGWNFQNIVVSSEDTSLFMIYNSNYGHIEYFSNCLVAKNLSLEATIS